MTWWPLQQPAIWNQTQLLPQRCDTGTGTKGEKSIPITLAEKVDFYNSKISLWPDGSLSATGCIKTNIQIIQRCCGGLAGVLIAASAGCWQAFPWEIWLTALQLS